MRGQGSQVCVSRCVKSERPTRKSKRKAERMFLAKVAVIWREVSAKDKTKSERRWAYMPLKLDAFNRTRSCGAPDSALWA
jgi:hypothetical protein